MTATGNNYAEALFILAREENLIDEFYKDLKILKDAFKESPEYLRFLSTPSIPKSQRTKALSEVFDRRVNGHILSFLQVLCEHGKAGEFHDCFDEYERLREWALKSVVAVVKTAVKLTEAQKKALIKSLEHRTGKSVTLKTVIDKTLLGGIVVEIDGEILDGSVKNNLQRAREVISE